MLATWIWSANAGQVGQLRSQRLADAVSRLRQRYGAGVIRKARELTESRGDADGERQACRIRQDHQKLTGGVRGLFKGNGVELVMGDAAIALEARRKP